MYSIAHRTIGLNKYCALDEMVVEKILKKILPHLVGIKYENANAGL